MLWPAMRLVQYQWATLDALQTKLNVEDMLVLNEGLDAWLTAQARANASKK